jgi:RND superfamily putative drug exporter
VIAPPARGIIRFRFLVIAFWLLVGALAIPRASRVDQVLEVQGESRYDSDSRRAHLLIRESFTQPIGDFFAVTVSGPTRIDTPAYQNLLDSLTRNALAEPYITRVVSYLDTHDSSLVSDDRQTTFFLATVETESDRKATDYVPAFRNAVHSTVQRVPWAGAYDVNVTGGPALDYDVRTVSKHDAELSERNALPFAAIVLILAFGALVAALLPLLVGVFAITCSLALVQAASAFYPMSVFVLTITTMVGLGVGIDYSLLIVTRFREELNRGRSKREAAERTIATAGKAVVTSGLTVIVGFASLLVTPITETRSVGIGGLFVVTAAVLLAVTFLPAVLSIMGRAIDTPKWLAKRLSWYHHPAGWERWARWLGQHPWRAIALGATIIALITFPLTQIKLGLPRSGWFPAKTESNAGVNALDAIGARGALQPLRVVLLAPAGEKIVGSRHIRGFRRLSDSIRADPRIAQVRSAVDVQPGISSLRLTMFFSDIDRARARAPDFFSAYLSEDARIALMDVLLADTTSLTGSMETVRRIRDIAAAGIRGLDSVDIVVGGFAASSVDLQDGLLRQFPLVIALVLVTTAVMMFIAFKSILVPLKAVVMNCLSVTGTFGITVLVFQYGWGARLFGLDGPTEAIYVVVPVLVFAIVFGLSMDYEVFLLSRIKEAFDRSRLNDQATMEGLTATASVITSAAAIMIIVFWAFTQSRVLAAQFLGFALGMAVLLDATLIRMVLVPAIMHIAGRWNWWPGVRAPREPRREETPSPPSPDVQREERPAEPLAPAAIPGDPNATPRRAPRKAGA